MIGLNPVIMEGMNASPEKHTELPVQLFAPTGDNPFAIAIEPLRPVEHGQFVQVLMR